MNLLCNGTDGQKRGVAGSNGLFCCDRVATIQSETQFGMLRRVRMVRKACVDVATLVAANGTYTTAMEDA